MFRRGPVSDELVLVCLERAGEVEGGTMGDGGTFGQLALESSLEACRRNLAVLMEVNRRFAATLDADILFQATTDGVTELVNLDSAAIYSLEGEKLCLEATTPSLPSDFPEEYRCAPLGEHPHISKALAGGKLVSIDDTHRADLTPAEKEVSEMRDLRSILYFPIQFRERIGGVLIVASCGEPREISDHEIELCKVLVGQAALVLENAQYHQQVQQYAENMESLVEERTQNLNALVNMMAGREVRMAELKDVIRQLRQQLIDHGITPLANDPLLEEE